MSHRKTLIGLTAASALVALNPGAAFANSSVSRSSGAPYGSFENGDHYAAESLVMFTELGKDNTIKVEKNNAGDIWFRDSQPLDAGTGCAQISAKIVSCAPAGATQIRVHAFDGANSVTVEQDVTLETLIQGSGPGKQTLQGGGGRDFLAGGDANDVIHGGGGDDLIRAGGGQDRMDGGAGDDVIDGEDGDDRFLMGGAQGLGRDTAIGGPGADLADYDGTLTGVTLTLDDVVNDGAPGEKDNLRSDVEQLGGTPYKDDITGSEADNVVYSGQGDNVLRGKGGNDTFYGGSGADTMDGGPGEDRLYSSLGDDTLKGGPGNDSLFADDGADKLDGAGDDDYLDGGLGADTITGGDGVDTVSYASRQTAITADLSGSAGDDGASGEGDTIAVTVERLIGGSGADTLAGNAAANVLTGNKGDDDLTGGAGEDQLLGGEGNDTLRSSDGQLDSDVCGDGVDKALADALDGIAADCETADRGQGNGNNGNGNGNGNGNNGSGNGTPKTVGPAIAIAKTASVKSRSTSLRLVCPKSAVGPCKGKLTLTTKPKQGSKVAGPVASVSFSIASGHGKSVKLTIATSAAKKLKLAKSLKVDATVVAADAKSAKRTSKRAVTLKIKR
jgi:Ca2+-binding RTX toxin-like protein